MALNYIVNGSPVEVKKHQLMGPVGYTKVGSPTIVEGVASGFSTNNYVKTTSALPSNPTSVEIGFHFNRASITESGTFGLFDGSAYHFGLYTGQNNSVQCYAVDNGSNVYKTVSSGDSSATYLKIVLTATQLTAYESTDGITYTQTLNASGAFNTNIGEIYIGSNYLHPAWKPYIGSIDLNKTYIKVNGSLWFYQPAPTKYIIKDGKLVWADPRLALSGPVNYTVVGSPKIEDGVVSDFTTSNNIEITSSFAPGTNPWEIVTKAKYTDGTISNDILSAKTIPVIAFYINQSSKLSFSIGNGTDWIVKDRAGRTVLSTDTYYYFKLLFDGSAYYSYTSIDGNTWILENSFAGSANMTGFDLWFSRPRGGGGPYFSGSIDLKETYIKVNNQLWFYGKNYASKNIAPVPAGYTYGNTTTSAIGFVDIPTQAFTPAPAGATIGRDE